MATNGSVIIDVPEQLDAAPATTKSLFLGHLYSYPTITAAVDYATHISVVQKLSVTARPYIDTIYERSKPLSEPVIKRASPVLAKADVLGDKILSRVDENFPKLKTTKPTDAIDLARKPYETVKSTAEAYSTVAHDRLSTSVVEPIQKAAERVKSHYATVYDDKGRSLVKSQVDPYIVPLNDRFEVLIKHFFPDVSDLAGAEDETATSSEISRTLHLAQVALQQTRPILDEQATHLKALPVATVLHIEKIYDEKLTAYGKEKTVTGPVYASLATVKQLSGEGVVYAGTVYENTKNTIKSLNVGGTAGFANGSTTAAPAATSTEQDIDATPATISSATPTTATTQANATPTKTSSSASSAVEVAASA